MLLWNKFSLFNVIKTRNQWRQSFQKILGCQIPCWAIVICFLSQRNCVQRILAEQCQWSQGASDVSFLWLLPLSTNRDAASSTRTQSRFYLFPKHSAHWPSENFQEMKRQRWNFCQIIWCTRVVEEAGNSGPESGWQFGHWSFGERYSSWKTLCSECWSGEWTLLILLRSRKCSSSCSVRTRDPCSGTQFEKGVDWLRILNERRRVKFAKKIKSSKGSVFCERNSTTCFRLFASSINSTNSSICFISGGFSSLIGIWAHFSPLPAQRVEMDLWPIHHANIHYSRSLRWQEMQVWKREMWSAFQPDHDGW